MLPDKALNTYKQLLKNHLTPDHHTISTLIHAYSKAKQPWKAQEIFDTLFALHNIEPDVIAWNGLLGAFALAGHKVQKCCNSNVTRSIGRLSHVDVNYRMLHLMTIPELADCFLHCTAWLCMDLCACLFVRSSSVSFACMTCLKTLQSKVLFWLLSF